MKKIMLLIVFLLSFLLFKNNVFSLTIEKENTNYFYSINNNYVALSIYKDNNKQLYCLQPDLKVTTLDYDSFEYINNSDLTIQEVIYIKEVIYFGYNYTGHEDIKYFLATQELIWEKITDYEIDWHIQNGKFFKKIDIETEKSEILKLVNESKKLPSFSNTKHKIPINEEYILVDENNIINKFEPMDKNITIKDNTLKIFSKEEIYNDMPLYRYFSSKYRTYIYDAFNSQRLIYSEGIEPVIFNIGYESKISKGILNIDSQAEQLVDYNDDFIYKMLPINIEFFIYAYSDIYDLNHKIIYHKNDLITSFNTDVNGKFFLELPLGNYYVKCIKPNEYNGYCENHISINESYNNVNLKIRLKRKSTKLKLRKFIEVLSKSNEYNFDYKDNIEFGIFLENDLKINNNLTLKKGDMIKKVFTNRLGIIDVDLILPYSNYYVKEITQLKDYKQNNDKYSFSINNTTIDYQSINIGTIINYLKKYNAKIKIDSNCSINKKIEVYNSFNKKIEEFSIEKKDYIYLNDYVLGKYYLKIEDDTKLYEFDLFNNLNLDLVLNCEITDENFKNTKKEETKKNDNLENDEIKKDDNQDNIKNDDITQIINISKNEKNSEKELDKSTRNENKNEKYEMPNTSSNVNIVLIMFLNIIIGFIFIIHKNET